MITKNQIFNQLKTIIDPELNINIVDLGLVYEVAIARSGDVEVTMTLTTPGCPLSFVFEQWIPDALKKIEGVNDVKVMLVWEPAWNPSRMSDDAKEELGMYS